MKMTTLCAALTLAGCFAPGKSRPVSVPGRIPAYSAAFSPDGRRLALGAQNDVLEIWDLSSNKRLRREEFNMGTVEDVAFAKDGSVIVANGGRVFRVPLTGPAKELLDKDLPGEARLLDGGRSLMTSDYGKVTVTRVRGGGSRAVPGEWAVSAPWEARHALVLGTDDRLQVIDAATLVTRWTGRLPVSAPERVQMIATSDAAAFVGTTSGNVFRCGPGSAPKRIASYGEDLLRLGASPDGRFVVALGPQVTMDGRTGAQLNRLDLRSVATVAFSPSGNTFVTDVPDGARLWDAVTGRRLVGFALAPKSTKAPKAGQASR